MSKPKKVEVETKSDVDAVSKFENPFRPTSAGFIVANVIVGMSGDFQKEAVIEKSIEALAKAKFDDIKVDSKVAAVIGILCKKGVIRKTDKRGVYAR